MAEVRRERKGSPANGAMEKRVRVGNSGEPLLSARQHLKC